MAADDEDDYLKDVLDAARKADEERAAAAAASAAGLKRKRPVAAPPPAPVSAKARLVSGLATALGSDNKGYALLRKAGWTPGQGAGPTGSGRSNPVAIDIRQPDNRSGIGARASREYPDLDIACGLGLGASPAAEGVPEGAGSEPREDAAWEAGIALRNAAASAQRALASACHQLRSLAAARAEEAAPLRPESMASSALRGCCAPSDGPATPAAPASPAAAGIDDVLGDPTGAVAEDCARANLVAQVVSSVENASVPPGPEAAAAAAAYIIATPAARLVLVLERMRSQYCYCLYCGESFPDAGVLSASCPGRDAADHD